MGPRVAVRGAGQAPGGHEARGTPISQIDVNAPSVARMSDHLLGGIENYASDRAACARLLALAPGTAAVVRDGRSFLHRAVRVLAQEHGVEQFLDVGFGVPTRENVHQIARRARPAARVVYLDTDPLALTHGRTILADDDRTAVLDRDVRDTDALFADAEFTRLIRPDRPTAALFAAVLHCLPDTSDPGGVVARVARRLAPGSFVVISHLVSEDADFRGRVTGLMREITGGNWGRVREPAEIRAYFAGMRPLPPGLGEIRHWRPGPDARPVGGGGRGGGWTSWGGVARV
ncbi:SAM-dependent methyltransferase [Streptomyces avicenniae]|uniref:SAM-dependent methyltransferase n=1 Tax=Streptomyces avicenniae TaxID=500153 RepID=UPI003B836081